VLSCLFVAFSETFAETDTLSLHDALPILNGAGGHDVHQQAKSRELIGQEYGMTGRNMVRYVRCDQLIPAFKEMLDDGSLTLVSRSEEHTFELQSRFDLVCRLLLEKKKKT